MDKAMSGKIGKKWAAILAGCIWAIFALAASVAFRTVTADALSINDKITVKAIDNGNLSGQQQGTEFTWGTFYRGVKLLKSAHWKLSNENDGTIELSDEFTTTDEFTSENVPAVSIDVSGISSLNEQCGQYGHDFTANAGSGTWESTTNGHWAVCSNSNCGFRLEVAHRPALDGSGKCADCGEPLGDDYINKYSFTLPDDPITWDPQNGATIEITINYINVFAGVVLKLNLSCSGVLTMEGGDDTISYEVSVSDCTVGEESSEFTGTEGTIWEFHASEYLDNGDMRTNINSASITVTLRPSGGDSSPYAGTYTDTLTFSVTLETE